jgi:hypothetical protein
MNTTYSNPITEPVNFQSMQQLFKNLKQIPVITKIIMHPNVIIEKILISKIKNELIKIAIKHGYLNAPIHTSNFLNKGQIVFYVNFENQEIPILEENIDN